MINQLEVWMASSFCYHKQHCNKCPCTYIFVYLSFTVLGHIPGYGTIGSKICILNTLLEEPSGWWMYSHAWRVVLYNTSSCSRDPSEPHSIYFLLWLFIYILYNILYNQLEIMGLRTLNNMNKICHQSSAGLPWNLSLLDTKAPLLGLLMACWPKIQGPGIWYKIAQWEDCGPCEQVKDSEWLLTDPIPATLLAVVTPNKILQEC